MESTKGLLCACILTVCLFAPAQLLAQSLPQDAEGEDHAVPAEAVVKDAPEAVEEANDAATDLVGPRRPRTLQDFVEQSDMIFHGVVENIEYRLSQPTGAEGVQVPYTFVTFRVEELIHGALAEDHVTLQFIGGLDETRMRVMGASIVPNFDLGDEDILFVKDNTQSLSPLVGNRRGRLRVIQEQVFTDTGRAIKLDETGNLAVGPRHVLEDVISTHIKSTHDGTLVLTSKLGPDAIDGPSDADAPETIIDEIKALARSVAVKGRFVNADPNQALPGPDMTAAAPPAAKPGEGEIPFDPEASELVNEIGPQKKFE